MAADDGEKSAFRLVKLSTTARYFVAAVVSVLILAVIVHAIRVVLRPQSLAFSVIGGAVFARRSPPVLFFDLKVRANNPSGRARMYYSNVTAFFFDRNTPAAATRDPTGDSLFFFHLKDNAVAQHMRADADVLLKVRRDGTMTNAVFDRTFNGTPTYDVTARLEGWITTEVRSGYNTTRRWSTYYCGPLVFGGDADDEAFQNLPDAKCREAQYGNFV